MYEMSAPATTPVKCFLGLKFASDREEDAHRIAQRQKQIDYGKNTTGYDRYRQLVPM